MTIPIFLFTGYLGSGKTTLLSRLLADRSFARSALLVNEVGEIGIDQALLDENGEAPLVLMDGGCVCCSIQGDLGMALRNLMIRVERGDIEQFERVIIETTGIACPAPILQSLVSDPWTLREFHIHSVVTCVDAVFGVKTIGSSPEAREQAIVADRLVLTKSDLADDGQLDATRQMLAEINVHATVSEIVSGACDAALFLAPVPFQQRLLPARGPDDEGHHHHHTLPVSTAAFERDEALPWAALAHALDHVARRHGDVLLRAKGFCFTPDTNYPILVQGVRNVFSPPRLLSAWPAGPRRTSLVFIVSGDGAAGVRDEFTHELARQVDTLAA